MAALSLKVTTIAIMTPVVTIKSYNPNSALEKTERYKGNKNIYMAGRRKPKNEYTNMATKGCSLEAVSNLCMKLPSKQSDY